MVGTKENKKLVRSIKTIITVVLLPSKSSILSCAVPRGLCHIQCKIGYFPLPVSSAATSVRLLESAPVCPSSPVKIDWARTGGWDQSRSPRPVPVPSPSLG